jgi:hypothetical protein
MIIQKDNGQSSIDDTQDQMARRENVVPDETGGEPEIIERRGVEGTGDPWTAIQSHFVDDPTGAVHEAAQRVREELSELMGRLDEEQNRIAGLTSGGSDVSTDDLRRCLQGYRDFALRLRAMGE